MKSNLCPSGLTGTSLDSKILNYSIEDLPNSLVFHLLVLTFSRMELVVVDLLGYRLLCASSFETFSLDIGK